MAVAIQIVCDRCGRRSAEMVWDGAMPRARIEDLRGASKGWTRRRPRNTAANQDLCATCAEEVLDAKRNGKAVS